MNNDIYEVDRETYVGFVEQIKPGCGITKTDTDEFGRKIIKIFSKNNNIHFCSRIMDDKNKKEFYYIFNLPADNERIPPRPKVKLELETKEQVQAFMNILSKLQKGEKI